MDTDRLTVSFCCNDDDRDVISAVEVRELIQLEGPMDLLDAELSAVTPLRWTNIGFWIGEKWFRHHGRGRHVGNLCWDSAEMDRAEVARLLNHLRTIVGWSVLSAETSLFDAWRGRDITVEDLERAIEP